MPAFSQELQDEVHSKLWPKSELPDIEKINGHFSYSTIRHLCKKFIPCVSCKQKMIILQKALIYFVTEQLAMHANGDQNSCYNTTQNSTPSNNNNNNNSSSNTNDGNAKVNNDKAAEPTANSSSVQEENKVSYSNLPSFVSSSAATSVNTSDVFSEKEIDEQETNENESDNLFFNHQQQNGQRSVDLPLAPIQGVADSNSNNPTGDADLTKDINEYMEQMIVNSVVKNHIDNDYGTIVSVVGSDDENENLNENENENDDTGREKKEVVADQLTPTAAVNLPTNVVQSAGNSIASNNYGSIQNINRVSPQNVVFLAHGSKTHPCFSDPTISNQAKLLVKIIMFEADKIRKGIRAQYSHQLALLNRKFESQMLLFPQAVRDCKISELDILDTSKKQKGTEVLNEILRDKEKACATVNKIISKTISSHAKKEQSHPKVSSIFTQ